MTNNDKVQELSGNGFNDFVKEGFVLVDFFADWCMPCVMMAPVIDELADDFKDKIKFAKVNIEDNQDLAQKFGVASIPNFILFKNGQPAEQFVGAMSSEDFKARLEKFI